MPVQRGSGLHSRDLVLCAVDGGEPRCARVPLLSAEVAGADGYCDGDEAFLEEPGELVGRMSLRRLFADEDHRMPPL